MNMSPDFNAPQESRFVEVLTAPTSGVTIGYCFGGYKVGPNALISGDAVLIDQIVDRLILLLTLPWMRGQLYLMKLDRIDYTSERDIRAHLGGVVVDELVMLPHLNPLTDETEQVQSGYWTVLRLCSKLGMIDGRGVN